MPHQQATLTTPHPILGAAGSVVDMAAIELHFGTTLDANAGIAYRCAGCGITVAAVITKPKPGGERARQASHFRALNGTHHASCGADGGARSPQHLRERLDALAAVLPDVDSVVILRRQGHLANVWAPGKVAQIIEPFADRVLR